MLRLEGEEDEVSGGQQKGERRREKEARFTQGSTDVQPTFRSQDYTVRAATVTMATAAADSSSIWLSWKLDLKDWGER